jgi:hypothetical protein
VIHETIGVICADILSASWEDACAVDPWTVGCFRGNNHPIDTDRIVNALEKLDDEYGVDIVYALLDFVEFIFEKPIEPENRARIRQRLHRLCPSAEELPENIRSGRIALWWD